VKPADIIAVRGIPKLFFANEKAVATWLLSTLPPVIIGICLIIVCDSVVIAPSDTVISLSSLCRLYVDIANKLI
jgi:hypothetical protein